VVKKKKEITTVHGHLIVSPYGHFSFRDEEMM